MKRAALSLGLAALLGCEAATPRTDEAPVLDQVTGARVACSELPPRASTVRRLTRFEYDNTVRELLGDTTQPARALPSEEIGNGFGNDGDAQSVSSLLAEQYATVAEGVAQRATASAAALSKLDACTASAARTGEAACARTIALKLAPRAYRRPLQAGEADALVALFSAVRPKTTFAGGLASMLEALLQSPDFLYRVEVGVTDPAQPARRRPSGPEMAARLSYLFWGGPPDAAAIAASASGALLTDAGVLAEARRLLADPKARPMIRFFFDNLLPISGLPYLERDAKQYPAYSQAIGTLLREETQSFLEYEIFSGSGTWPGALTAPYTFLNEQLAGYYGVSGVRGAAFQKVSLDKTQRLGLLTQGGIMAGTTPSNFTNPVLRGSFVVQKLMCRFIPLPSDPAIAAQVKPPDPYSGKTARERFSAHSKNPVCASCHKMMDPVGLTFENYDAVGRFRTQEQGVTIDASGALPGVPGDVKSAIELIPKIAAHPDTQACFALQWLNFAYGRTMDDFGTDECTVAAIGQAFERSGYNVRQLLLDLTQTAAFLYLPAPEAK